MPIAVEVLGDRPSALNKARAFLESDPLAHNVILTLLHAPERPGVESRYVIATDPGGGVVGVLFQSPITFMATITPMSAAAVEAIVDGLASEPIGLPSVVGDAATAARFAGQWTEKTKCSAVPDQGQRIYEVDAVRAPSGVSGSFRRAGEKECARVSEWLVAFGRDAGEVVSNPAEVAAWRIGAGHFWLWEDDVPVSMAALTPAVAGVARVQAVYTPDALRGRGYAAACVASLSAQVLRSATRCILYTDLGNPVSNSVYRRIGYRAVSELVRYQFGSRQLV